MDRVYFELGVAVWRNGLADLARGGLWSSSKRGRNEDGRRENGVSSSKWGVFEDGTEGCPIGSGMTGVGGQRAADDWRWGAGHDGLGARD